MVSASPGTTSAASPTIPAPQVGTGTFTFNDGQLAPFITAAFGTGTTPGVLSATGQLEVGAMTTCPELKSLPGFDSCLVVGWQVGEDPLGVGIAHNVSLQNYDTTTANRVAIPTIRARRATISCRGGCRS